MLRVLMMMEWNFEGFLGEIFDLEFRGETFVLLRMM
jgi:hypothetical protein